MERMRLGLSSSVEQTLEKAGPETPISAVGLAQIVLKLHPKYAGGLAESLKLEDTASTRVATEWVDDVRSLFDPERIQSFLESAPPTEQAVDRERVPTLHGRLFVVGLSLLEPDLRKQLERASAFEALVKEIREPLTDILTERGRALYTSPPSPSVSDTVPSWPDDPMLKLEQDLLGRAAFAEFLAKRIDVIERESGAYSIHIYGPWGAGKTSLLNFLREHLKKSMSSSREWLVVDFNAWRHQHIQPPWWSLMEAVFKETKRRLGVWERLQEYTWRFLSGRMQYLLGLIIMAWLLALVVFPLIRDKTAGLSWLASLAGNAESLSKILALVATLWGGVIALNRSLLLGSAHAAQRYTELTADPTNQIKRRFTGLINKLLPSRVAILVDDLDRCQSHYVVDLLEGMQTLFREAPVVFVVAADRNWLNACYEEVYQNLRPRIHEPGKALGTLFLEKAFRFSTPMPGLPEELKESYWRYLLKLRSGEQVDASAAREKARDEVAKARDESEVRNLVEGSSESSFIEQRALREEAVVRLASPEILQRLEHTLQPYAHLLEPNPRAMKLLVNSYSANSALTFLSQVGIGLHQLVLWTILCSRWPQLADRLASHPEDLDRIGNANAAAFDGDDLKHLEPLRMDTSVMQVTQGAGVGAPLTKVTLEQCARMHS